MADATTAPPTMMSAPAAPSEYVAPRRLFAFLIMVFGMFMSILDIQIVSASLAEIQAGLSASSSEVSWVQTSYLIAEVIAIPLSGFLSRALGTRLLFAISASGFTIASFFCGFASSIEQMILWRAIQGFLGAGMIPTVFASAYSVFPQRKLAMVKPAAEIANSNRVPSARDRNPDNGIAITSAIKYEVWTHDTSLELADKPAWISVSDAETTWMSRIDMNIPNTMMRNANSRRGATYSDGAAGALIIVGGAVVASAMICSGQDVHIDRAHRTTGTFLW